MVTDERMWNTAASLDDQLIVEIAARCAWVFDQLANLFHLASLILKVAQLERFVLVKSRLV